MAKRRRRNWSDDEKRMICAQTRFPGVSVSQVARRYDVNANQVFNWLKDTRLATGEEADDTACFLPVEIVGSVPKAEEISAGQGRRRPRGSKASLHPANDHGAPADRREVPHRVKCNLRIVGTRLDAEVTSATLQFQLIAGERRQIDEGSGLAAPEADAVFSFTPEQTGTEPQGERQAGRSQALRLTRIARRARRAPQKLAARRQPSCCLRSLSQQRAHVLNAIRRDIECGKEQVILLRGCHPGLARAIESNLARGRTRGLLDDLRFALTSRKAASKAPRCGSSGSRRREAQESTSRDAH